MRRVVAVCTAALLLAGWLPAAALAHEGREVGQYNMVVGFRVEPALIDEPNSVYLRVTKAAQQEEDETGHMAMDVEEHGALFSRRRLLPLGMSSASRSSMCWKAWRCPITVISTQRRPGL